MNIKSLGSSPIGKMIYKNNWLVVSNIFYFPFHIWDVIQQHLLWAYSGGLPTRSGPIRWGGIREERLRAWWGNSLQVSSFFFDSSRCWALRYPSSIWVSELLLMDGMHERIIEVSRCGGELRNFHLRIMWEVGLQNCLCCPLQGKRLLAEEKPLLTFPEERLFRFWARVLIGGCVWAQGVENRSGSCAIHPHQGSIGEAKHLFLCLVREDLPNVFGHAGLPWANKDSAVQAIPSEVSNCDASRNSHVFGCGGIPFRNLQTWEKADWKGRFRRHSYAGSACWWDATGKVERGAVRRQAFNICGPIRRRIVLNLQQPEPCRNRKCEVENKNKTTNPRGKIFFFQSRSSPHCRVSEGADRFKCGWEKKSSRLIR